MIGENLRKVLEKSGVRPTEVSRKTGIPTSRISEILTGKTQNPGIDTIFRISESLGANLNFIASGQGEMFSGAGEGRIAGLDEETVATVMGMLDQLEDFFGEKLPAPKKAKIFTHIYAEKIAGKPLRLADFAELLKSQG